MPKATFEALVETGVLPPGLLGGVDVVPCTMQCVSVNSENLKH